MQEQLSGVRLNPDRGEKKSSRWNKDIEKFTILGAAVSRSIPRWSNDWENLEIEWEFKPEFVDIWNSLKPILKKASYRKRIKLIDGFARGYGLIPEAQVFGEDPEKRGFDHNSRRLISAIQVCESQGRDTARWINFENLITNSGQEDPLRLSKTISLTAKYIHKLTG